MRVADQQPILEEPLELEEVQRLGGGTAGRRRTTLLACGGMTPRARRRIPPADGASPTGNQPIDVAGRDVEAAVLDQIANFRIAGQRPLKEQFAESLELFGVGHVAGVQVGGVPIALPARRSFHCSR